MKCSGKNLNLAILLDFLIILFETKFMSILVVLEFNISVENLVFIIKNKYTF